MSNAEKPGLATNPPPRECSHPSTDADGRCTACGFCVAATARPTPSVQATAEPPESALPCNLAGLTDDELIGLVLNVPDGPSDVEMRQIIEHVRSEEQASTPTDETAKVTK